MTSSWTPDPANRCTGIKSCTHRVPLRPVTPCMCTGVWIRRIKTIKTYVAASTALNTNPPSIPLCSLFYILQICPVVGFLHLRTRKRSTSLFHGKCSSHCTGVPSLQKPPSQLPVYKERSKNWLSIKLNYLLEVTSPCLCWGPWTKGGSVREDYATSHAVPVLQTKWGFHWPLWSVQQLSQALGFILKH